MVTTKSNLKVETNNYKLPTLDTVKEDAMIQSRVEQRLQELSGLAKTGTVQKLKSQRGRQVEVMVKNRVKWPHEYVLSGLNKERVSYDQLSVTQWVAGFGRTMRDESDPETRQYMLEYMISLMDDANDFSCILAKASHAVLLCRMEQGEVKSYADVLAIDRIRRANAQKHVSAPPASSLQNSVLVRSLEKPQNPRLVHISLMAHVYRKNLMRPGGVLYKHICASCFALAGKTFSHPEIECKNKHKGQAKKRISLGDHKQVLTRKDRFLVNTNNNAIEVNNQL